MKFSTFSLGCLLLIAFSVLLSISFLPAHVFAQSQPPTTFPLKNLKFSDVIVILNRFVTWIFTVFLIIAVLFVIFAAFQYLVHGSDPQGVKKATHMLVYAAIAIAVALLSVGTQTLVKQLVTGQSSSGGGGAGGNACNQAGLCVPGGGGNPCVVPEDCVPIGGWSGQLPNQPNPFECGTTGGPC